MGLKETIASEKQSIRDAQVAQEQRKDQLAKERRERYSREFPEMILAQRPLLLELRQIGVLDMIEEMTVPSKISYPQTPAEGRKEEKEKIKSLEEMEAMVQEVKLTERDATEDYFRLRHSQEWTAHVKAPAQLEDGSLDPNLRIEINNSPTELRSYPFQFRKAWIDLTYTPDRVLTIEGAQGFTFGKQIDPNSVDLDPIERGLARAFISPIKEKVQQMPYRGESIYKGS